MVEKISNRYVSLHYQWGRTSLNFDRPTIPSNWHNRNTGYIIQWWVTITQRPPPEMVCIYCNGGVWKIQLFHFYTGIWTRTIKFSFGNSFAKYSLLSHQKSFLYQYAWPSYWLFSSEINTNLWAFLTDSRFLKAIPAQQDKVFRVEKSSEYIYRLMPSVLYPVWENWSTGSFKIME